VAAKVKMMELAKELGVTSKELMVAAEEMGHKGLRAMSPLDTTLANALRVKLGRGRELPEEPKPKRAAKPKDVAATDGAPATKKAPARSKKVAEIALEEPPAEIKPAATIVKPKPAPEIASELPLVAKLESEIAITVAPSSARNLARNEPTFPKPCTATVVPCSDICRFRPVSQRRCSHRPAWPRLRCGRRRRDRPNPLLPSRRPGAPRLRQRQQRRRPRPSRRPRRRPRSSVS